MKKLRRPQAQPTMHPATWRDKQEASRMQALTEKAAESRTVMKEWTPFIPGQLPNVPLITDEFQEVFINSRYQVYVRHIDAHDGWPAMIHLSVKRLDREIIRDWRDMQRIKNELVGLECEGVELYPAKSRLVDASNQYHIYVFALPKHRFPFGYNEGRLVMEAGTGLPRDRSKQRPFELKPTDLTTSEEFQRRVADSGTPLPGEHDEPATTAPVPGEAPNGAPEAPRGAAPPEPGAVEPTPEPEEPPKGTPVETPCP